MQTSFRKTKIPSLTSRQRTIISHLVAAPDQKTAAEWLGITDRQIRRHVDAAQKKLGVETKNQAIVLAALSGQLDPKAFPANTLPGTHPS